MDTDKGKKATEDSGNKQKEATDPAGTLPPIDSKKKKGANGNATEPTTLKQADAGLINQDYDPENETFIRKFGNYIKYLFFGDAGKIIKSCIAGKRDLEPSVFANSTPNFTIEEVYKEVKGAIKEWEKASAEAAAQALNTANLTHENSLMPGKKTLKEKPKVVKPLWRGFVRIEKKRLIWASILRLFSDVILILIPVMVRAYEGTFTYTPIPDTNPIQYTVTKDVALGFTWMAIVILTFFIQYLAKQHSERIIVRSKLRLEQAIKSVLFKKLLSADYVSIAKSDPNTMSKILFFGLDNLLSMFTILPALFSAPVAIILGCILIWNLNSHYFFLIAVFLFVIFSFLVIDWFNVKSAKHQGDYDEAQSLKSIKIEEFFDNITTIQTNSLGDCLKIRFQKMSQHANNTLQYMHTATGVSEVLLVLSPFLFTAISFTIYHFLEVGHEGNNDSIRLMICMMAPMTIPLKVITESLYRMRLFRSSEKVILDFTSTLKKSHNIDSDDESNTKNKPHKGRKKTDIAIKMVSCSFLKDDEKKVNLETVLDPKKMHELKKPRYLIFRDNLNKATFNTEVKAGEDGMRKLKLITKNYQSLKSSSNLNFCLKNLTLSIETGSKICVVGDENSGKHEFFLALMNELVKAEGTFTIKQKASYLDMNNPRFIRDTIKENILLGRELNKELYNNLTANLVQLRLKKYPKKDRTIIVDGQKNIAENDVGRILMARLLYSEADVVMINNYFDRLSKERQYETYINIVENYLADKTVLFSTNLVHLIKRSDRVLMMRDGKIIENDTYDKLMHDRNSQLYKFLMTDPAGNTNLFRKVLDLFKITIKRDPNKKREEPPKEEPVNNKDNSPSKKQKDKLLAGKGPMAIEAGDKADAWASVPTAGADPTHKKGANDPNNKNKDQLNSKALVLVGDANKKPTSLPLSNEDALAKEAAERNQEEMMNLQKQLEKLQKNIMSRNSLAMKVVFIGKSTLSFYLFFLTILCANLILAGGVLLTCFWGVPMLSFLESFTSYMLFYDAIVIVYVIYVVLRDVVFTKRVIANMAHLYSLTTNSLINTQKEYLLVNPSTRIIYLLTKIISKLDRDFIRSYYLYFDCVCMLLAFLGVLNYLIYIFMAIVTIFLMIVLIPINSSFSSGAIKLSTFVSNWSSELIEIYMSSFNFILPLRNHQITSYYSKKFNECADTLMKAKIRLEDDIYRWFHLRYMIYATILVLFILLLPELVLSLFDTAFLNKEWQLKFVTSAVPILLPILMNFPNSMTESSVNLIYVKNIIQYLLELSKNSEDTSIIRTLAHNPKKDIKDIDHDDIYETNLSNFILKNTLMAKNDARPKSKKVYPIRLNNPSELGRPTPGDATAAGRKRRVSPNEPTKPLLMLKNVSYISQIKEVILDNINLKLYEAERVALICELGSGKDFLISLLMTLIQRSKTDSESNYEIMGKVVEISTASELRKNMTYLYPKPLLLMGTVRDNIDPFGRYDDEDIIRTLHFLKIIRVLQEYSLMSNCEDIGVFLSAKEGKVSMYEICLEDIKAKSEIIKRVEEDKLDKPKKGKKDKNKMGKRNDLGKGTTFNPRGPGSPDLSIKNDPRAKSMLSPMGVSSKTIGDGKSFSGLGVSDAPEKYGGTTTEPKDGEKQDEEDMLSENDENGEDKGEDKISHALASYVDSKVISSETNRINIYALSDAERRDLKASWNGTMRNLKNMCKPKEAPPTNRIEELAVKERAKREADEEELNLYFEEQFVTEYPIPKIIPERAKRINEDLEDFDMDYDNHTVHFKDEYALIKQLLYTEVGQNGRNLNEDTRKIIMMAKIYLDKPPILIVDEDSLYITGVNKTFYVKQLFKNLKETGILSFTKDFRQLYLYTSVAILEKGKMVEQGPPFDLIDDQDSRLYGIVMRDDIRTLRQLENKLDKNLNNFEMAESADPNKDLTHLTGELSKEMFESGPHSPIHHATSQPMMRQNTHTGQLQPPAPSSNQFFKFTKTQPEKYKEGDVVQEMNHSEIPKLSKPSPSFGA